MKCVKKYNLLIISSFVLFFLWKCSEPKIGIPEYTPKIAVDGYIEVGHPPVMYLTYSSPFISEYDSLDFVDMVKFNVAAYVITEEGDTIGFTRRTDSSKFPPFKYTMSASDLIGEVGKSYKLFIRKEGEPDITATTSIPDYAPDVLSIGFEADLQFDTLGRYQIFIENEDRSLYFFIENKKYGEKDYYPVRFPAKSNRLYEDDFLSFYLLYTGNSNLWLSSEEKDSLGEKSNFNEAYLYHINDTIIFKVSSIDDTSFEVLSSVFLDTEFPDNPFKPISELPVSNVSNGIGRWTGMNSITYLVTGKP